MLSVFAVFAARQVGVQLLGKCDYSYPNKTDSTEDTCTYHKD